MALLGHGHRSQEQQQEVREARRLLKERVRNDWDFPPLPAFRSTGRRRRKADDGETAEDKVAGFRFHTPNSHDREGGSGLEAVEWRERECSSETESDEASAKSTSSKGSSTKSSYKFDGPDSVGAQISSRRTAKKRKRQKELEEEVGWNEGLAHWMRRRNVWCGARSAAQVREFEGRRQEGGDDAAAGASVSGSGSAGSTPRTSTSSTPSPQTTSSAATTPDPAPAPLASHPPVPPLQHNTLTPVCAPILPNHPIRRRITPTLYPEIYAKIILQSRTPSVPLNLAVLVAALIQGWKDDGEWPPKPSALEPSMRKKGAGGGEGGFRNGVKAVGRVLRLTGTSESGGQRER